MRKHDKQFKKNQIPWNKGLKIPFKARHPRSEETKRKLREFNLGHKHTLETRIKMSNSRKGNKNPKWKGGITPENKRLRNCIEYNLWRKSVYERDDYSCIWCGVKGNGKNLNADHIKPFADYPELRFAIDNGRTLCVDCHRKTATYAGKGAKRHHYKKSLHLITNI